MNPEHLVKGLASLPGRCVHIGTHAIAVGVATALDTALVGSATTLGVGSVLLKAPAAVSPPSARAVAGSVGGLIREAAGGKPVRRCASGSGRTWVEIRGLDGPNGPKVAERALTAVRAIPGVDDAALHRPWSRIVVSTGSDGPDPATLCRIVAEAETGNLTTHSERHPFDLPGDDAVLTARAVGAAVSILGFGVALIGRSLRLPRLPAAVASGVISVDYQPRLRRLVENTVGPDAAGALFATMTATAYMSTLSPDSLAVEAARRSALVAEAWSGRRAWQRIEPTLTAAVDGPPRAGWQPDRVRGPVERYSERAGLVGLASDVAIGAMALRPAAVGSATLVSAPKAARTARELFAAL